MAEQPTKHMVLCTSVLGDTPDAVVMEIGAVAFDPYGPTLEKVVWPQVFYKTLTLQSMLNLGRVIDEQALLQLMRDEDTRNRVLADTKIGIATALELLSKYCADHTVSKVWCQRAGFSAWTLTGLYKRLRKEPPWSMKAVRDINTLHNLSTFTELEWTRLMERQSRSHPAELAWAFARTIQHCLNEDHDGIEGTETVPGQQPLDSGTS